MSREVMQQALDALYGLEGVGSVIDWAKWEPCHLAVDALRAALAQPEQSITEDHSLLAQMLYEKTPPSQMGLNDRVLWRDATPEARRKWIDKAALAQPTSGDYALGYAEGFNDACKPKAQPEQEPKVDMCRIAQFKLDSLLNDGFVVNGYAIEQRNGDLATRGFITDGGMVCWWTDRDHEPMSPPQRQPLTGEQIDAAVEAWFENDIVDGQQPFAKRMRAAFKAAYGIGEKT
jgi:hypothetical protein